MNYQDLLSLRSEYRSYEGTCNNSANKNEVAANKFESLLNAAMSLAGELEDLKKERRASPNTCETLTAEDVFLMGGDEEPDEAKQTADFARYG